MDSSLQKECSLTQIRTEFQRPSYRRKYAGSRPVRCQKNGAAGILASLRSADYAGMRVTPASRGGTGGGRVGNAWVHNEIELHVSHLGHARRDDRCLLEAGPVRSARPLLLLREL